jgi:small ligand-binding sensory domain FIST
MKCASALSTARSGDAALAEVEDRIALEFSEEPADLALAFVSAHHSEVLGRLSDELRGRGLARHVVGCTGESIIGEESEIERSPAISLWAIRLPKASLQPIRLWFDGSEFEGWPEDLGAPASTYRTLLLLGDPFSFPADRWFQVLAQRAPGLRVLGGMASAATEPGENRLVLDVETFGDGAVGVLIDGPVVIRTVVSQGCRPIGRPMIVTKTDRNLIQELGRRPSLEVLAEMLDSLDEHDRKLVREGLHVGRVINEYQDKFTRGDFLVRNVIGAHPSMGIAVSDQVRVGQTVQFHLRDAATADEDLRMLLGETKRGGRAAGALLFSCNGRGTRFFPQPNHDIGTIHDVLGPVPTSGFFAMGEFGPVGGQNFVHGFTASIALFESSRS